MAISQDDIIRVALTWLVNSLYEQVNVHPVRVDAIVGTPTDDQILDDIVNEFQTHLYTNVVGVISNNVVGNLVNMFNLTQNVPYAARANPIDGTSVATDALPYQTTALVFMNGNARRRQGRCYLPVSVEVESTDQGVWSAPMQGALANFVADWIVPMVGTHGTYSRVITDHGGVNPILPSFGGYSTAPRTQRRRTPGRGS